MKEPKKGKSLDKMTKKELTNIILRKDETERQNNSRIENLTAMNTELQQKLESQKGAIESNINKYCEISRAYDNKIDEVMKYQMLLDKQERSTIKAIALLVGICLFELILLVL